MMYRIEVEDMATVMEADMVMVVGMDMVITAVTIRTIPYIAMLVQESLSLKNSLSGNKLIIITKNSLLKKYEYSDSWYRLCRTCNWSMFC